MRHQLRVTLSMLMLFANGICLQAQTTLPSDRKVGEIFVAIGNGQYQVWDFSATPTLVETIVDGTRGASGAGNGDTAGCAINSTYHPFTTNVTNNDVFKDMINDPQTAIQTIKLNSAGGAQPTSIAFDSTGNAYVGVAGGNGLIEKYDPSGAVTTLPVNTNKLKGGSAWMDLSQDASTIYFTNGTNTINQFAVSSSRVSSFQKISGATLFGLRALTLAAQRATTNLTRGPGVLLVAAVSSGSSNIQLLNSSGATIKTYSVTTPVNEANFQVLTLDPNGTSFWAGNPTTNNFYRFNLASGNVEIGPVPTGVGTGPSGLCAYGAFSAAQPQPMTLTATFSPSNPQCNVNSNLMDCTFSSVVPPPSKPESCPTTVIEEPTNNCFVITLHGINLSNLPLVPPMTGQPTLQLTYNYSQISPAAGTSDPVPEPPPPTVPTGSQKLTCDLTSPDGKQCEVHSIDLTPENASGQTNIYASFDLVFFSTSAAPTIVNPRVVRDGDVDVTDFFIKDFRSGGSGNSVFTINELTVPNTNGATAQSCGYTSPLLNSTYNAGRTIPFKFQAVAAGVSCSTGPYLGTGTLKPRLVLLQLSATGATAQPVSYTLSNGTACPATTGCYYNLDPTSNTWKLNVKTSGLTGGGTVYFGTTFDDDNQIPSFSSTASGAAVNAFTLN